MNARGETLRAILEDDGSAVGEETIIRAAEQRKRETKSALHGLEKAGVLESHGYAGSTYYSIVPGLSRSEIKQAVAGKSAAEAAEEIMQSSPLFDDPDESDLHSDYFTDLV